jgi:hypothetical protein
MEEEEPRVGVRRDGGGGSEVPMRLRVPPILAGAGRVVRVDDLRRAENP